MTACRAIPPAFRSQPPLPRPEVGTPVASANRARPRAARRHALGLATAVAFLVLLCLPAALAPMPPVEVAEQAPAAGDAWPTDVHADPTPARPGAGPKPVPTQKRAPCTAGLEREVNGACWIATEHVPPNCPPQTVAHEGKCLLPVAVARPVPNTVDGGESGQR